MRETDKLARKFLEKYINNTSPTGFESSGQKLWLKYLQPYIDEWEIDDYGNAVATINPGQDFRVVIEAHADEISWFVNYISDKGMVRVIKNGGSDGTIAPSKRVHIHTKTGPVMGVFGWPAVHLRDNKHEANTPKVRNIFIDIGAKSKKEALEMGIQVGNVATFQDEFLELNNRFFCGRSLDNKIGGFAIAEVARKIKENKIGLPFTLLLVNSVQEEVGLKGAKMIAARLHPNAAIITDVTHDTSTPMIKAVEEGDIKCGDGPSLAFAPAIHYKLLDIVMDAAEENEIPYQRSAYSRSTGTDTESFAYSHSGIPTVLISTPLKYMHTTVEMCAKSDVTHLINLIYNTLLKITPKTSFKYFDKL
ncbi:MAG: M20/M25/M40 family metallo-hydrolase [Saprospiraceae bacterium]